MGFKLGEGQFKAFTFDSPNYSSTDGNGSNQVQIKKSEIKVEFFKTQQQLISSSELLRKSIRKAEGI